MRADERRPLLWPPSIPRVNPEGLKALDRPRCPYVFRNVDAIGAVDEGPAAPIDFIDDRVNTKAEQITMTGLVAMNWWS